MNSRKESQLALFEENLRDDKDSFTELCKNLGVERGPRFPDRFGAALYNWAKKTILPPIRTLSLFSGAGGLDIAFHDAGFSIVSMVEIEERFVSTLNANCGKGNYFGDAETICIDIRDYHPPQQLKIDFIIGGPPCQSFSAAGRRAAGVQGTEDARGSLFEEYVRLLKHLRPRGFLFENVYGITGAGGGKAWQRISEAFSGAGYQVFFRILDAADYGVPQHRERAFIVGTQNLDFRFPCPTHGPDSPGGIPFVTAAESIIGAKVTRAEREAKVGGRYGHLLNEIPAGLNYSFFTERMGHHSPIFAWRSKFSDFLYKADPKTPIRTLKAQGGQYTGPFHWKNRPFAISELKRLQTFPEDYIIRGGKQAVIHQIGNSVPPQLGRILAISILRQVFHFDLPGPLPLLGHNERLGFRQRKRGLTSVYLDKAQVALSAPNERKTIRHLKNRSYRTVLTEDFILEKEKGAQALLHIDFVKARDAWTLLVNAPFHNEKPAFAISISPRPSHKWALDIPIVKLLGAALAEDVFTAAWKAFEAELVRFHIKADLVQLCGYYQYEPNIRCSVSYEGKSIPTKWKALTRIVEGIGTREIISLERASALWNIKQNKVLEYAKWLRSLGYEVRNRKTNPQIPAGHLLVPYSFPTLTRMSVQLRKSLT